MPIAAGFTELEHTADVGFRAYAPSLPGLFYQAARALLHVLFLRPPRRGKSTLTFTVEAEDPETLLVRFLNELLYQIQTRGRVPAGLYLHLEKAGEGCRLTARMRYAPFDPEAYGFLGEVKSATFHGLKVEKTEAGYAASVVLDV